MPIESPQLDDLRFDRTVEELERRIVVYDVLATDSGRDILTTPPAKVPAADTEWLAVTWDGKAPKLKDLPTNPVALFRHAGAPFQPYVWVGANLNPALDAGVRGVRVTLTVQFDDDERPDLTADVRCDPPTIAGESAPAVDWLAYYDADAGTMRPVPGRIDDTTARLTRSGTLRFTVPLGLGPI